MKMDAASDICFALLASESKNIFLARIKARVKSNRGFVRLELDAIEPQTGFSYSRLDSVRLDLTR